MKKNKIVVFGGSGFIGSHVADHLSEAGYKVFIYDLKKSSYLQHDQEMVVGDILDQEKVDETVKGAYAVYNFAAIADLDKAINKPVETINVNLLGTVKILEACRKNKVGRFIYASTVYVHSKEGGFYRCSKQAAEDYIHEFHYRYEQDYCILRYGSLYGPRSGEDNGLWQIVNNAVITGELQYMGNPESLREYIHVDDAAKISVKVIAPEFANETLILTGHHRMRLYELMEMINEIMGNTLEIQYGSGKESHYHYTPYSFTPRAGKKIVMNTYNDLGQSLLQMLNENLHGRFVLFL